MEAGAANSSGTRWDRITAAFTPDGSQLITAGRDGTLRTWDVRSGNQIAIHAIKGYSGFTFSNDRRRIAARSDGHGARIWDVESGREISSLVGHGPSQNQSSHSVSSLAFSPDGRRIVSASTDWTARVWDVESGRESSCSADLRPGADGR